MPGKLPTLDIDGLEGPLAQRVYTVLRNSILDMSFEPGMVLRKGALCEQLNVSRSPVGEALGKLSSEGLVDIVPQSATRVSQLSLSELREESFLREAIEVAAVAKVAADRTEEQLTKLTRNLRMQSLLVEDHDFLGFFEVDMDFHELILGFTGYPTVVPTTTKLSLQIQRARVLLLPEEGRPAEAVTEHNTILDAIKAHKVDVAKAAMSRHLQRLLERIDPLERQYPRYFRAT